MLSDFSQHSRFWRQRPAIIEARSDLRISYRDLAESISGFGVLLDRRGIRAGERISIIARSSFQECLAILACLGNGVVANPLNPNLPAGLRSEFITHAEPALILTDDLQLVPSGLCDQQRVLSVEESIFPLVWKTGVAKIDRPLSDGGLLIYTSGATGAAKGVLLSVENIEANVATAAAAFAYAPGWVSACLLPLYHTFGLISDVLPILLTGGTVVVLPTFEMGHAKLVVDSFKKYGVRSYSAAPIILEAFTALDCLTDTSLRFAISGAAPLDEGTKADYETRFGHPIIPCYGLSESTCFATISPLGAVRANSVGKAAGIEICVLNEDCVPLPTGETGEIALRGPSVVRNGYYRDTQGYSSAFIHDGWLLTGDVGRMDEDGYVYVTGRRKNMVIRGGEKVYLEDLDRSLVRYPGVARSASIVISARETWDRAISFIIPCQPTALSREGLNAYVQKSLGNNHVPDDIVFTEKIPMTPTGKPSYVELKALYQSRISS
jgi:acyl-CoA synthetase (AMP-forming)/AMP-acid ligase II